MRKVKLKKGFTLIELIVVMAVIGVLVLLAMPKFMGYTKKAHLTEIKSNIRQLENASERFYLDKEEWPKLTEEHYTSEEIEAFAQEILSRTGQTITLDPMGKYYDIDYKKLQKYVQEPKDGIHYIIQNPVGEVFYLDGLTQKGIDRQPSSEPKEPEIEEPEVPTLPDLTKNTMLKLDFRNRTNSDANKSTIVDTSGHNITATLKNFGFTVSGWMGDGLLLDGVDDYVLIPTSANTYIKPTSQLTISTRVYRDNWNSATKDERIYSITHVGGWCLVLSPNYIQFLIMLSGDTDYTTINFPTNKYLTSGWHTLTTTFDGKSLKLYVDGELITSKAVGNRTIKYTRNNALLLGAEPKEDSTLDNSYGLFKGKMSDFVIYNKALSTEEIQALNTLYK